MSKFEDEKKLDGGAFEVTTEVEYENDKVHQDTSSYRRVAEGIPTAAWFILVNEFW